MSSSMRCAESPRSSTVICWAVHGMASPSVVLNARQSCRKSIIRSLQFFDFLHEVGCFIKPAVKARVADVSDRIEGTQTGHDALANGLTWNFAVVSAAEVVDDLVDEIVNLRLGNWTFLAGLLDAVGELFTREVFAPAVAFDDHELVSLDLLVGGVSVAALYALAATADGCPFA